MSQPVPAEQDLKPATVPLAFKADADLADAIAASARANERSLSAELRVAVRFYLAAQEATA